MLLAIVAAITAVAVAPAASAAPPGGGGTTNACANNASTQWTRAGGNVTYFPSNTTNVLTACSYFLRFQNDGNLVVYYAPYGAPLTAIWSTGTYGIGPGLHGTHFVLQGDGNLVVYGDWGPLWNHGVRNGSYWNLVMQFDSNLVQYCNSGFGGTPNWNSGGAPVGDC